MPERPEIEQLTNDLNRLFKAFGGMRHLAPLLHPGVEGALVPLLFKLSREPMRVGALADCIHSDISTVSRQVSTLVAKGLVEKTADPDDGRAQLLAVTPRGREVAEALRRQRQELLAEVLVDWPDAKIATASASITALADAFDRAVHRPDRLPAPVSF